MTASLRATATVAFRRAIAPLSPLAREATISILVNGKLDVMCDPRNYGGDAQRFFLCPTCSKKVQHLYLRDERLLACRRCAGLTYASQHTRRRGRAPLIACAGSSFILLAVIIAPFLEALG
jgi:hypothetical protein